MSNIFALKEKTQAIELWQTVAQELDRLQKLYQEYMTEAQIHVFESQKQKVIEFYGFLVHKMEKIHSEKATL